MDIGLTRRRHSRRFTPDPTLRRLPLIDLSGKIAVITGAGGGIGREIVARFQASGATVVGCDADVGMMDGLDFAHRFGFDLTDPAACGDAVARIEAEAGPIAILVNNAGFTRAETLDQVTDQSWERELAINLSGARNLTDRALPAMRARGAGAVVFISSVNALSHVGNPAYSAAKAGLLAYARAVAVEYGREGIRANCILPGSVITPAWDHRIAADPRLVPKVQSFYPLGRTVTAQEVAAATLFLASDWSSGITGVALPVDAGLTAGNMVFLDTVLRQ
jgi:NAD(P)-dependent dehydrogenase (short-subunit alcohol dehydrogenase family)